MEATCWLARCENGAVSCSWQICMVTVFARRSTGRARSARYRLPRVLPLAVALAICLLPREVTAQYAERREVTRTLVLGGPDAPEWQAFSREPQLHARSGGGALFVAPDHAGVIIVDPTGQRIRQLGRQGEGPGEFQTVGGFGIVADTLWLRNWPDPRISQFDTAGNHLRTWRSPVSYEDTYSSPQGITGLLRDGYRYATADGAIVGRPARTPRPVLLLRGNVRVDTIVSLPGYDGLVVERLGIFRLRPFPRPPLMAALPDGSGLLFADWSDGPDVSFSRVDHTGRVVHRFTHSFARAVVPDRFLEAIVDSGVAMARGPYEWARQQGRPVPSDLRAAVETGLDAPRYFPPFQDMFVARDGNLWLHLIANEEGGDWLVLEPDGKPLWQIEAPDGVRFQAASGSSVWGTWVGDLDVPYVARFEVVGAVR